MCRAESALAGEQGTGLAEDELCSQNTSDHRRSFRRLPPISPLHPSFAARASTACTDAETCPVQRPLSGYETLTVSTPLSSLILQTMRRIASVLASRRADKDKQSKDDPSSSAARPQSSARPQPARKASRLLAAVSRSRITVSTEQPVPPLDQGLSSSSSCGSNSIQTPDDDRASPILPPDPATLTPVSRKGWNPWANAKKAPTAPPSSLPPSSFPSSRLTPLAPNNRSPREAHHDTDDDATSDSSSESDEAAPSNHKPPVTHDHALSPIEHLTFLTSTGLVPPFSPCPLQHVRGQPLFPRSCNPSRSVLFRGSLESTMHRSRLLRRLERDSSSGSLSKSDRRMLASFGPRLSPSPKRTLPQPDEGAFPDVAALDPSGTSRGLRAWLARGYFEERTVAWKPSADGSSVAYSPVTGSGFGVWALDVSRALEEMAGAEDLEDGDWPLPVPVPSKSSPPHSPASVPTFIPDAPSSLSSSSSQRSSEFLIQCFIHSFCRIVFLCF